MGSAYERVRYGADALTGFAGRLLTAAGLPAPVAADVAEVLVEGDLLGHDTHGLSLLAPYLAEIDKGTMTAAGEPEVLSARASVASYGTLTSGQPDGDVDPVHPDFREFALAIADFALLYAPGPPEVKPVLPLLSPEGRWAVMNWPNTFSTSALPLPRAGSCGNGKNIVMSSAK